jgi:hypothetical protein
LHGSAQWPAVTAERPDRLARHRTMHRLLLAALICAMPVVAARADPMLDARIAAIVAAKVRAAPRRPRPAWLAQVYPPSNAGPVWFTAAGPHRSVAVPQTKFVPRPTAPAARRYAVAALGAWRLSRRGPVRRPMTSRARTWR